MRRGTAQGRGAAAAQWADEVRELHKVAIVWHTVAAGFCLTESHCVAQGSQPRGPWAHSCEPPESGERHKQVNQQQTHDEGGISAGPSLQHRLN